jgi:cytoskeletal protein CcmA (bactofilin family)
MITYYLASSSPERLIKSAERSCLGRARMMLPHLIVILYLMFTSSVAHAIAANFDGSVVAGCNITGKVYTCTSVPTTAADAITIAAKFTVTVDPNITVIASTGAFADSAKFNGNLQTITTMALAAKAKMVGNLSVGSTLAMAVKSSVKGNVISGTSATISAGAHIDGSLSSGSTISIGNKASVIGPVNAITTLTMGVKANVTGSVSAGTTIAVGVDGYVIGSLTAGTTLALGAKAYVDGDVSSLVSTVALGAKAYVTGNLHAGTTVSLTADAYVLKDLIAGTTLTMATGSYVGGNATTGTTTTMADSAYICGNLESLTSTVTMAANSFIAGNITSATVTTTAVNSYTNGRLTALAATLASGFCAGSYTVGSITGVPLICSLPRPITSCISPQVVPDHLEIVGFGSGVTCVANTFTIRAWEDAAQTTLYTGDIVTGNMTNTGNSNVTYPGGDPSFTIASGTSSTTMSVGVTTPGTTTFDTTTTSATPNAASSCTLGGVGSCEFSASSAGFIFSDTATGTATVISSQTAGISSPMLHLRAVETNTSTGACQAALNNSGDVTLSYSCNNPSTCSTSGTGNYLDITPYNGATVQPTVTVAPSGSLVNLYFDVNGSAALTFNYRDAGRITLNASKSITSSLLTTLIGYSNDFVTKPASFSVTNIRQTASPYLVNPTALSASDNKFVKAGEAFSAVITAITSSGDNTPNYGNEDIPETGKLNATLVLPNEGMLPALIHSTNFGDFIDGSATGTTFAWDEVGIISLTPSVGDADYLGEGNVLGMESENVGRFYPSHFETSLTQGCSTFTYAGQPFSPFQVSAYKVGGTGVVGLTQNYSGNFSNVIRLSDANDVSGGSLSSTIIADMNVGGAFTNGVYLNSELSYSFTPIRHQPDTIQLRATEMIGGDAVTSMQATPVEGITEIRSGRVSLLNAFGSELLDLPMTMRAEYWQNATNGWQTNMADNCTDASLSLLPAGTTCILDNGTSSGSSCSTTTSNAKQYKEEDELGFLGNFNLWLEAPGSGNTGSVDVTADVPVWLQYNWTGVLDNPKGRATFGIYNSGSNKIIHRLERY